MNYNLELDLSEKSLSKVSDFCTYILKDEVYCGEESLYIQLSNWMSMTVIYLVELAFQEDKGQLKEETLFSTEIESEVDYIAVVSVVDDLTVKIEITI